MLDGYQEIIRRFVSGENSAEKFETEYLKKFKYDEAQVPSEEFQVLDSLFADVDDYVSDPELREQVGGLDDEELRARARVAYDRLYR
jgi:hypothetical protein